MRYLLVSDSPFVWSAYAQQTMQLARSLIADGHEVMYYGATHYGNMVTLDGVNVVGAPLTNGMRPPMMVDYAHRFKADVVITMKDPYSLEPSSLRALPVPWIAICPVDTEPLDLVTQNQLTWASAVVALTPTGQQALREQGINAYYAPHGIDTGYWTPGDKISARQRLNLPADVFMPLFVGVNNSNPSRKNIDQLLLAWKTFLDIMPDYRDACLFLHTSIEQVHGGIPIMDMLDRIDVMRSNWRTCDQVQYEGYNVSRDYLRDLYRAADVLVSIGNEGFCVPVVEAQACGCPVLAVEFAALRDTARAGWKIPQTAGETVWHDRGAFWFRPNRRAIVQGLTIAAEQRHNATLPAQARQSAVGFDWSAVWASHWKPMLSDLEQLLVSADLGIAI